MLLFFTNGGITIITLVLVFQGNVCHLRKHLQHQLMDRQADWQTWWMDRWTNNREVIHMFQPANKGTQRDAKLYITNFSKLWPILNIFQPCGATTATIITTTTPRASQYLNFLFQQSTKSRQHFFYFSFMEFHFWKPCIRLI